MAGIKVDPKNLCKEYEYHNKHQEIRPRIKSGCQLIILQREAFKKNSNI